MIGRSGEAVSFRGCMIKEKSDDPEDVALICIPACWQMSIIVKAAAGQSSSCVDTQSYVACSDMKLYRCVYIASFLSHSKAWDYFIMV